MSDVANLDEAEKCLEIAKAALQVGNLDKATRFAEKAMKLHPHDEASSYDAWRYLSAWTSA